MTSEEKKARELVEKWGIKEALLFCDGQTLLLKPYNYSRLNFWRSVREHILKLKNEWK